MRLLEVVQRYGREVAGGAETHCRQMATRLAARGHDVDVVTSCAVSYVRWEDHYPSGADDVDGVTVHRLPVERERDIGLFGPLNGRTVWGRKPVPFHMQREWMRMQGPLLPQLVPWLEANARGYDAVVFFTYLYYTAWAGLPVAAGLAPTVLHPTAHEEPALELPLFETTFRHPTAFAFSTPEERDLVCRRFRISPLHRVIGIGFDPPPATEPARFRACFGLGDDPFLLVMGRVDAEKGADEVFDYFLAYKERHRGSLRLVVVGERVKELPVHPDVRVTGFVDDQTKHDAYAAASLLVQPSYFESFSMVLAEAWLHDLAAVVQGHCGVLAGQARRSGGAVPYRGFGEFEAAVEVLLGDAATRSRLGSSGRRYVTESFSWDVVLDRYEDLLERATSTLARRPGC